MSDEKKIEEMTNDLENHACLSEFQAHITSRILFILGYRKQVEGEWIWINQATGYLEPPYGDTCKCSLCEFVIDVSESNYKYCPNCGAKMKGGG